MSKNNNVVTFGCRLNIYESEIIKKNIEKSNLDNVIVFNTCTVTKEAERQARHAIRKAKKENPDAKVIVTGCAAQNDPDMFAKMDEVDKVIGNEEKLHSHNYNFDSGDSKVKVNDIMEVKEVAEHLVSSFDGKARAFLQVQNGCDHRCTFCIIPYGRGNSRSVPIGAIVQQIRELINAGYHEVVFTGVDVTSYGADLPGKPTFSQMIRRVLGAVPELKRLRLSSIDVAEIDDDLFNMMAYEKRLMPHFHISLQAGDNMILKRMKRRHNREQVLEYCHKLKTLRPEVAFGADIIAGFPTETDEMFENTRRLITEAGIQFLHVFPYSEREGTPAAKMPPVEPVIRKKRAAILRAEGEKEMAKFLESQIGSVKEAIIEKGGVVRTENFIPAHLDVDLEQGNVVKVKLEKIVNGKMIASIV